MKVGGKKAISCSENQAPVFLTTPPKKKNPFFRQLIKINQYNYYNCTSSEKIVLQHIYISPISEL